MSMLLSLRLLLLLLQMWLMQLMLLVLLVMSHCVLPLVHVIRSWH